MQIKIKKTLPNAVIPTYAHDTDAGLDLTAASVHYDKELDCWIYDTGIAIEIPEGYVGLVFPRSSNRKTNYYLTNHVGVIDSGYRGSITASFKGRDWNTNQAPYNLGDRIVQLIIMPYPKIEFNEVDELSNSDRGNNGHGSTGA